MSRLTHGPGCVKAPTIWAKSHCHTDTVTIDRLKPALVEPISPTDSSVEGETSETLSFSPTSSSEIDNIFAEDLDELPANRVYSRKGRLITKPIRYRD